MCPPDVTFFLCIRAEDGKNISRIRIKLGPPDRRGRYKVFYRGSELHCVVVYQSFLWVLAGIGFGGTPSGLRIDMYDISDDGLSMKSVIHMPVGVSKRFRGLRMGYDNALYVTTDSGNIMKVSAE